MKGDLLCCTCSKTNFQVHRLVALATLSVAITWYRSVQPYVDLKPQSYVIEVCQLSQPNVTNEQVQVSVELTSQVKSIFCCVLCQSHLVMPDPFQGD